MAGIGECWDEGNVWGRGCQGIKPAFRHRLELGSYLELKGNSTFGTMGRGLGGGFGAGDMLGLVCGEGERRVIYRDYTLLNFGLHEAKFHILKQSMYMNIYTYMYTYIRKPGTFSEIKILFTYPSFPRLHKRQAQRKQLGEEQLNITLMSLGETWLKLCNQTNNKYPFTINPEYEHYFFTK